MEHEHTAQRFNGRMSAATDSYFSALHLFVRLYCKRYILLGMYVCVCLSVGGFVCATALRSIVAVTFLLNY